MVYSKIHHKRADVIDMIDIDLLTYHHHIFKSSGDELKKVSD